MAKRTVSAKNKKPKSASGAKTAKTKTVRSKTAKPTAAQAGKTRTAAKTRTARSRTENEMSTSILDGRMKSLIADALLKRK